MRRGDTSSLAAGLVGVSGVSGMHPASGASTIMRTLLPISGTAGVPSVGALSIARNVRFTRQFAGNGEKSMGGSWAAPAGGLVGAAAGGVSLPLGLALPSPLGRWARDTAAGSDVGRLSRLRSQPQKLCSATISNTKRFQNQLRQVMESCRHC